MTISLFGKTSLVVFLIAFAFFAYAADVEVGVSVSANTQSGVQAGGDADRPVVTGEAQTKSDDHPGGPVMSDDPAGRDEAGAMDDDSTMEDDAMTDDDDDEMMEEEEDERGNEISVQAVEVRGWDPEKKQAFLNTVKAHAEVKSGQDLENFAKGILLKDEDVDSIAIGEEGVQIAYRARGKLFGFIPLTFKERITVQANATAEERVTVRFPWYGLFLSADVSASDLEAALVTDLDDENITFNPLATGGTADVSASADVSGFAEALQALSSALKTRHDTVKNSVNNIR